MFIYDASFKDYLKNFQGEFQNMFSDNTFFISLFFIVIFCILIFLISKGIFKFRPKGFLINN